MTKRGSEDLIGATMDSSSPVVTVVGGVGVSSTTTTTNTSSLNDNQCVTQQLNGNTSPSQQHLNNNNNNDSSSDNINTITNKKVKLESQQPNGPNNNNNNNTTTTTNGNNSNSSTRGSRVVHVRNIPADTNDSDLVTLALPFGRVTNCLVLRGKSQAFVEFDSNISAQQMVAYWSQTTIGGVATTLQPTIRGRNVFCQLSNHKELKVNHMNMVGSGGSGGGMTMHDMNPLQSNAHSMTRGVDNDMMIGRSGAGDGMGVGVGGHGSVGDGSGVSCVLRVVVENLVYPVSLEVLHSVFSRAGKVAKIVTFTKNGSFQALIQFHDSNGALNAKHALDGQCLFHSANTLRIEFSKLQQLNVKYNNDKSRDYTNPSLPSIGQYGGGGGAGGGGMGGASGQSSQDTQQLLNEQSLMSSLLAAQNHLGGHGGGGGGAGAHHHMTAGHHSAIFASPFALSSTANTLRALSAPLHHALSAAMSATSVLLVSNLNESTTTTEALFTLFGVYGDVIRVKILFNKKDNALIQMSEPSQAQLALTYLDKVKLFGRVIRVTQSKHALVQMPKEGQHDAGLTKDFSQSPLHRFKKPGSKNYGNIYPPSATLHLSNIPSSTTEEDIRDAFSTQTNATVVAFKFFPKDRKMALIQLSSVEEAITALISMHNYQLSESSHLRVSFSKSSI